jgi:integrase
MTCRSHAIPEDRSIQNCVGAGFPDTHSSAGRLFSGVVGVGVDVDGVKALAAALAQQLGALAPALDTRTLGEALLEVEQTVLAMAGRFSASTVRNTKLAFAHVLSAPLYATTAAPLRSTVARLDEGAACHAGRFEFARGCPRHRRCAETVRRPLPVEPEGDAMIEHATVGRLRDVRICDLDRRHVTAAWNALAGPSLSSYAAHFVARLGDAEELGFVGLKRWRDLWPSVPQPRRRNIEVSDEIHREVLRCLEWALDHTSTEVQTLRLLAFAVHTPGRLDELCSLRLQDLDLRGLVLRLEDSKTGPRQVPLTTAGANILRAQIQTLRWDATWVWPACMSALGHMPRDTASHAWLRMRRAYAEATERSEARALLRWRAHDFRGGLATQALEHGASVRDVQNALGHADVRTTERYVHGRSMTGPKRAMEIAVKPLHERSDYTGKKRGGT